MNKPPIAQKTRTGRWVTTSLGAALMLSLMACTALRSPIDPIEPARLFKTLYATGVQIYECRPGPGSQAPAWTFVAPDAELFDGSGRSVGTHGAGPSWTSADGSRVLGSVHARMNAPTADAVAWLLLKAHSTGGTGAFSAVTQIQRLRTEGGVAPADGCGVTSVGQRVRVRYRAEYHLFAPA